MAAPESHYGRGTDNMAAMFMGIPPRRPPGGTFLISPNGTTMECSAKALIPAVCSDIGGVCGVVLESGRAFLYNGTDVPARKAVDGTLHTVEPHTIIQVR